MRTVEENQYKSCGNLIPDIFYFALIKKFIKKFKLFFHPLMKREIYEDTSETNFKHFHFSLFLFISHWLFLYALIVIGLFNYVTWSLNKNVLPTSK